MIWLALAALVIAAFAVPRFGKFLLRLMVVLIALAVVGAIVLFVMNQRKQAERRAARERIGQSEIELVDLTLQPSYGIGSYKLLGRVRNRSARYTLIELRLRLTMSDCEATKYDFSMIDAPGRPVDPSVCEVVSQTEDTARMQVPPGQARDLDEFVSFSDLHNARGKHQWKYEIVEILGR